MSDNSSKNVFPFQAVFAGSLSAFSNLLWISSSPASVACPQASGIVLAEWPRYLARSSTSSMFRQTPMYWVALVCLTPCGVIFVTPDAFYPVIHPPAEPRLAHGL